MGRTKVGDGLRLDT